MLKQFKANLYTGFWYKGGRDHPTRVLTGFWQPTHYRFIYLSKEGKVVEERGEATSQYLVVSDKPTVYWWLIDGLVELQPVQPGCNVKHSETFEVGCTAWKHVKSFRE